MSRIADCFATVRGRGEAALVPFFTAGDPDLDTTAALVRAAVDAGAHAIELGVPFSDPMADGPVLQRSAARALAAGTTLARVLATPLDAAGRLRLVDVPRARRLDELEFYYPLERFDDAGLRRLLRAHGLGAGPFAAAVDRLRFEAATGFMKGFIDLVFEADGRWWLVDYKSNRLGDGPDAYAADRLPEVMARHAYFLQYLVYTLVLHRMLRLRLPGYDYERHVGGVFYLFLRGMDPARGPASGVFHDAPPRALVEALDRFVATP